MVSPERMRAVSSIMRLFNELCAFLRCSARDVRDCWCREIFWISSCNSMRAMMAY